MLHWQKTSLMFTTFLDCLKIRYQVIELYYVVCVGTCYDVHTITKLPNDAFLKTYPHC